MSHRPSRTGEPLAPGPLRGVGRVRACDLATGLASLAAYLSTFFVQKITIAFLACEYDDSDECVALMIEKECEHMPCGDYLEKLRNGDFDFGARREILDWICKVHSHFNFGPLCLYLSVNYLDRFLSAYDLPKGKVWMIQLLAVACLSLAAKMEETEVPLSLDLQCDWTRGIHFLEFKPSEIAAAVAISVVVKTETVGTEKATSALLQLVQEDRE
ncbi:Cyclin-D2-1 [Datura stramonium]|uniref:Cyclin-D2-1 n=1 Tax=Datura stramonium TaxID=4076 RepID=A0ABS8UPK6_DATST|nr:Cyclin-D2-1 [Datura stramonium]